jgi:hypothetical protein
LEVLLLVVLSVARWHPLGEVSALGLRELQQLPQTHLHLSGSNIKHNCSK